MRNYHKTSEKFRSAGEKTHGKGKHKAHKVGDRISFKTPKGRTSGKVVAVHKEFYTVVNKNVEHKVNRNSILYSMGTRTTNAKVLSKNKTKKGYGSLLTSDELTHKQIASPPVILNKQQLPTMKQTQNHILPTFQPIWNDVKNLPRNMSGSGFRRI